MDLQVTYVDIFWESRHSHSQGCDNHSGYSHLSYHGKKNHLFLHNSNHIHRRVNLYHRP